MKRSLMLVAVVLMGCTDAQVATIANAIRDAKPAAATASQAPVAVATPSLIPYNQIAGSALGPAPTPTPTPDPIKAACEQARYEYYSELMTEWENEWKNHSVDLARYNDRESQDAYARARAKSKYPCY